MARKKASKGKGWFGDKWGHSEASKLGWKNHCKNLIQKRPKTYARLLKLR